MSTDVSLSAETSTEDLSGSVTDDWDLIPIQPGSAELSVESALLWCLNPAIHGIKSIGVISAVEKAQKLIASCNGDTTTAIVMASGSEGGGSKRSKIIFDFLLRQVPIVGCPAYILTSTWTHVRCVATIAAIYGHDLEHPRTQHEILWCLLPQQPEAVSAGLDAGPIGTTARTVSTILVSTALKKAIGVSMVSELFRLGTDLWSVSSTSISKGDDDEYEHLALGPAATARHYFCPETAQWSQTNFILTLIGVLIPWLFRIPTIFTSVISLSCLIVLVKRRRFLSMIGDRWKVSAVIPRVAAYTVFFLHAGLPVLGISNGIFSLVSAAVASSSTAERLSQVVLGLMALSAGLKAADIRPDFMHVVHIEARKIAIFLGILIHVLPLLDRQNTYTPRIAYLLSDTQLCSFERSLHYISVVVSSTTQHMLFLQLRKREVILRLLGAERLMVLSLTLFFRGITAAVSTDSLLPLFRTLTPHPVYCCFIMTLRRYPVSAASLCALLPLVPVWISYPAVSLVAGLFAGVLVMVVTWLDWKENENVYLSNMRLLFILPGVITGKTKQVVDSMLQAGGKTAIKSVLVTLTKKLLPSRLFKFHK